MTLLPTLVAQNSIFNEWQPRLVICLQTAVSRHCEKPGPFPSTRSLQVRKWDFVACKRGWRHYLGALFREQPVFSLTYGSTSLFLGWHRAGTPPVQGLNES
jgi:hypothetical protein